MKKMLLLVSVLLLVGFVLLGCGKKYECRKCDAITTKAYYDMDGDAELCEDCARTYWAPFDYNDYRIK